MTVGPSLHGMMQENMSKLSSYASGSKQKGATQKLIKKQHHHSTADKFGFDASQYQSENRSLSRETRPQSIDPRLSVRKNHRLDLAKKGDTRKNVSQDSHKSSNSLRPTNSNTVITRVTKAKMMKIERLKQLYV